jgi:hypothetical protein
MLSEGGTPDDRSGSMDKTRRTKSQNRFEEGRVCLVIRAGMELAFDEMD